MNELTSERDRIGRLCLRGDCACEDGDLDALADVARELAAYAREPLHCDLVALADGCHGDPARATAVWSRLKERVAYGGPPP